MNSASDSTKKNYLISDNDSMLYQIKNIYILFRDSNYNMISKLEIAKDKWNSNKLKIKNIKNSIYDYV